MSSLPPINLGVNTVDAVANQLRAEIIQGSIEPGERILPKDLAKRFSVSHIPVREALRRLEAEDLVAATSHGATYASQVRLEDIEGVYEVRTVLEGEFARRSAQVRSEDDIGVVQRKLAELEGLDPYGEQFYVTHREFHWALLAPAANDVIRRVLDRLWRSTDRYLAVAVVRDSGFPIEEHAAERRTEHRQLAADFAAGDGDATCASVVAHLSNTRDRLRGSYLSAEGTE